MCAYNKLNGVYCSENAWLFEDVLRKEWGFEGVVMTDWGATNNRVAGIRAGIDLEMPGSAGANNKRIKKALLDGSLSMEKLDECVARVLCLIRKGSATALGEVRDSDQKAMDAKTLQQREEEMFERHHNLAYQTALECIVLLKNENNILPLERGASVALIGDFCQHPRFQGMGSSGVNATRVDSVLDLISQYTDSYSFSRGYDQAELMERKSEDYKSLIAESVQKAQEASYVVIMAGLPETFESEGFDRSSLDLPASHSALIQRVCEVNPNTIVVLSNGGPVRMPWIERIPAILEGGLLGQAGAKAMLEIIFGVHSPSGKLAETFIRNQLDAPSDLYFPGDTHHVEYREGLHVGYRYFDTAKVPVLFPFGHGLSYSSFLYRNLNVSVQNGDNDTYMVQVSFSLKNTGAIHASEVIQCYVHHFDCKVDHPEKELRDFQKVSLKPDEQKRVHIRLDKEAFSYFDVCSSTWLLETGTCEILLGSSSRDTRLSTKVQLPKGANDSNVHSKKSSRTERPSHPLIVDDTSFAQRLGPGTLMAHAYEDAHNGIDANSFFCDIKKHGITGYAFYTFTSSLYLNEVNDTASESELRLAKELFNRAPFRTVVFFSKGLFSLDLMDALIALMNGDFGALMKSLYEILHDGCTVLRTFITSS